VEVTAAAFFRPNPSRWKKLIGNLSSLLLQTILQEATQGGASLPVYYGQFHVLIRQKVAPIQI